ncbi:MAG: DUF433 domain-containing protein [Actinomycetota bacterium]|nr:DUF433 domain-containing protein [Actinomycetota bacterium]
MLRAGGHGFGQNGQCRAADEERPIFYSFRDVVALRTFVYLREDFSLQAIRAAVHQLRDLGEMAHLASYSIVADVNQKTILLVPPTDAHPVDLLKSPGQTLVALMADVIKGFRTSTGRAVPDLRRPSKRISIDPSIKGGHPVIAGTRVGYELVAALLADGVEPSAIHTYYPTVNARDALDAQRFASQISALAS